MNTTAWLISIPLASSPLIYLIGHAATRGRRDVIADGRASWWFSLIIVVLMWVVLIQAALDMQRQTALIFTVETLALRIDGLSLLASGLVLGVCTVVILYSAHLFDHREGVEKYYATLMATTGTMIGMVCADDLFNLWMWFEAMLIASFVMVSFYRLRLASLDASVKYLMQSATGSILALVGIALVLGQTGTLALNNLPEQPITPALLAAGALFLIGFGVKTALVPMHTWLPDAYAETPSSVGALLSGAVTVSGVIALARAFAPLVGAAVTWGALLMVFGAVNMLVGNLLALRQPNVKRLLAFSSISHIGYMLLGVGIGIYTGRTDAAQAGLFHMLTHGAMKSLAFLAVGALLYSLGEDETRKCSLTINDLHGLAHRYPLPGVALLIALLSLAGIPPLAGFMSKWQIFLAGFAAHDAVVNYLIIFAVLNTLLAVAYYLPLMIALFRPDEAAQTAPRFALPTLMRLSLIVFMALILVVGVLPDLARWLTESASLALMSGFTGGGM